MSDLIRRQAVIDALIEQGELNLIEIKETIEEIPSADPERTVNVKKTEREKGKWQRRKGEDCWECSVCHAVLENSDIGNHNFYYCYHCGADMMDICGYMDLEKANYE